MYMYSDVTGCQTLQAVHIEKIKFMVLLPNSSFCYVKWSSEILFRNSVRPLVTCLLVKYFSSSVQTFMLSE